MDPKCSIWSLYISYVECCVGDADADLRGKSVKSIIEELKRILTDQQQLFNCLNNLITLSCGTSSKIEKANVYSEIVQLQKQHLPISAQLLNKCYLFRYIKFLDVGEGEGNKQVSPWQSLKK